MLRTDQISALLREAMEPEEQQRLTRAVLALVTESGTDVRDIAALSSLRLPTGGGSWLPAGDLLLPGTALASAALEDAPLRRFILRRRGGAICPGSLSVRLSHFGWLLTTTYYLIPIRSLSSWTTVSYGVNV